MTGLPYYIAIGSPFVLPFVGANPPEATPTAPALEEDGTAWLEEDGTVVSTE